MEKARSKCFQISLLLILLAIVAQSHCVGKGSSPNSESRLVIRSSLKHDSNNFDRKYSQSSVLKPRVQKLNEVRNVRENVIGSKRVNRIKTSWSYSATPEVTTSGQTKHKNTGKIGHPQERVTRTSKLNSCEIPKKLPQSKELKTRIDYRRKGWIQKTHYVRNRPDLGDNTLREGLNIQRAQNPKSLPDINLKRQFWNKRKFSSTLVPLKKPKKSQKIDNRVRKQKVTSSETSRFPKDFEIRPEYERKAMEGNRQRNPRKNELQIIGSVVTLPTFGHEGQLHTFKYGRGRKSLISYSARRYIGGLPPFTINFQSKSSETTDKTTQPNSKHVQNFHIEHAGQRNHENDWFTWRNGQMNPLNDTPQSPDLQRHKENDPRIVKTNYNDPKDLASEQISSVRVSTLLTNPGKEILLKNLAYVPIIQVNNHNLWPNNDVVRPQAIRSQNNAIEKQTNNVKTKPPFIVSVPRTLQQNYRIPFESSELLTLPPNRNNNFHLKNQEFDPITPKKKFVTVSPHIEDIERAFLSK